MKRSQPRRDWRAAREKVEREDNCRLWRDGPCSGKLEAAHIIGRQVDFHPAELMDPLLLASKTGKLVHPNRIVPLCTHHHRLYDAHEVDLGGVLTTEEEAQAVLDTGSLENARVRTCPSLYKRAVA